MSYQYPFIDFTPSPTTPNPNTTPQWEDQRSPPQTSTPTELEPQQHQHVHSTTSTPYLGSATMTQEEADFVKQYHLQRDQQRPPMPLVEHPPPPSPTGIPPAAVRYESEIGAATASTHTGVGATSMTSAVPGGDIASGNDQPDSSLSANTDSREFTGPVRSSGLPYRFVNQKPYELMRPPLPGESRSVATFHHREGAGAPAGSASGATPSIVDHIRASSLGTSSAAKMRGSQKRQKMLRAATGTKAGAKDLNPVYLPQGSVPSPAGSSRMNLPSSSAAVSPTSPITPVSHSLPPSRGPVADIKPAPSTQVQPLIPPGQMAPPALPTSISPLMTISAIAPSQFHQVSGSGSSRHAPPMMLIRTDVHHDKSLSILTAMMELPGIKKSDLSLSLSVDPYSRMKQLIVVGKSGPKMGEDGYTLRERKYGDFKRILIVPPDTSAEHVKATLEDGILTLGIPLGRPLDQQEDVPIQIQ